MTRPSERHPAATGLRSWITPDRLAAILLLVNVLTGIVGHVAGTIIYGLLPVVIDSALAIGLLHGSKIARTIVLIRACVGLPLGILMLLAQDLSLRASRYSIAYSS